MTPVLRGAGLVLAAITIAGLSWWSLFPASGLAGVVRFATSGLFVAAVGFSATARTRRGRLGWPLAAAVLFTVALVATHLVWLDAMHDPWSTRGVGAHSGDGAFAASDEYHWSIRWRSLALVAAAWCVILSIAAALASVVAGAPGAWAVAATPPLIGAVACVAVEDVSHSSAATAVLAVAAGLWLALVLRGARPLRRDRMRPGVRVRPDRRSGAGRGAAPWGHGR